MSWETLPGFSTFPKARRKELARRLVRLVQGEGPDNLLSLDEVRGRLGLHEQWYVGLRTIKVSQIVGSVDRATDFDREFLPKRPNMEPRWRRVEETFETEAFPPIVVFKVDDAYFVEDGHHRVAIARQRKTEFIDADITEVKSPIRITPTTDVAEIVHQGLRRWFMRESGLQLVRPQAAIEPSRPHAYTDLLDIVQANAFELMIERQAVCCTGRRGRPLVRPSVRAGAGSDPGPRPAQALPQGDRHRPISSSAFTTPRAGCRRRIAQHRRSSGFHRVHELEGTRGQDPACCWRGEERR